MTPDDLPEVRALSHHTSQGKTNMSTMNYVRKKTIPRRPGGIVLPPDVEREWDDLIWSSKDEREAARKELRKWFVSVKNLHYKIGKRIAADFNRQRTKLLTATLEKLAAEKLELVLMEQEEKRQAAIKAYYEESQRQAKAYT